MTAAAAVPVAALRLVRGAARRHAPLRRALGSWTVKAALFLGGLLALGLLCAGQAYAAEPTAGTVGVAVSGERLRAAAPETTAPETTALETTVRETVGQVAAPAAAVVPAAERVVGRAVTTATETVRDPGPGLTGALPAPDQGPSAPGLPALPPAPELPQAPAPVGAARADAASPAAATGSAATGASVRTHGEDHRAATAGSSAAATTATTALPAPPAPAQAQVSAPVPVPAQAPAPEPCHGGACFHTSGVGAGDSGSPRGGDQHAVASVALPYPGPVRGAGLPATVAPTQDRPHDVLEFPG
ncbi:hypothetical protein ACIRNI_08975 [Streptomyces sp. NPDC093546]|uniref:hypothetical protein n=1 Tax=Streptomyces sp. NPDC093546 TaxID=3366040 RepID=UPI0038177C87